MKNSKWEKYNLTTITPVFIGSDKGSDLSKTTDFIIDGNQINIIDQRKFEALLNDNIELINEFVSDVKNNPRSFDLQNFIENKLNTSVSELTKTSLEVDGYLNANSVNTFITTNGKHFIPGSTIKGAIRTSLVYSFLINSNAGKLIVSNLLDVKKKLDDIKKRRDNNEQINREESALLSWKGLNKHFEKIYNEFTLFKTENNGHDFRHILINDSEQIEPSKTKITELRRTYMIKDSDKTSQWKQVLKENVTTQFSLKVEDDFKDSFLNSLNSKSEETLISLINKFSKDVIDFELEMYKEFSQKKEITKKLNAAIEFYKWLKDIIEKSNNKFAVMRIGGGKTYFDNSIGLALFKKDKERFKEFRKLLGFWKHRSGNRSFVEEDSPITRTYFVKEKQLLPIGWIVIYKESLPDEFKKSISTGKNSDINTSVKLKKDSKDDDKIDFSKLENLGRISKLKN
jgi:CRISPR-associated protein Csm5